MKKNLYIGIGIFLFLSVFIVGCGEKKYENNFTGVYSYVEDNAIGNTITFYNDWGYYGAWVETKGFISAGNKCITVSFYSFTYTDETKNTLDSAYSIYIDYDGSKYADYLFNEKFHSINVSYYSKGVFSVGKYDGYNSNIILSPSETNMSNQPKSSFSLLTTVLRQYIHSKGFTLDSLGYILYK